MWKESSQVSFEALEMLLDDAVRVELQRKLYEALLCVLDAPDADSVDLVLLTELHWVYVVRFLHFELTTGGLQPFSRLIDEVALAQSIEEPEELFSMPFREHPTLNIILEQALPS